MRPSNIEVGATYRHSDHPDCVYLGCGSNSVSGSDSVNFTIVKKRKFLILLKESANPNGYCGARVYFKNKKSQLDWWSKLFKI